MQRAERGDHLCSFHGTADEHRRLAAAFVRTALGAGDRALYVGHERDADAVRAFMEESGARADGRLVVLEFADVYGSRAAPDLDVALTRFVSEAERARADGFPGLRIAMDMGDFLPAMPSLDAVTRWEQTVTQAFDDVGIVGLCQYDERRVDPEAQAGIAAAHRALAADDGTVPRATFAPTEEPWGLAPVGELDVANARRFERALQARAVGGRRVHLDLGGLRFADVSTVRAIFRVAAELPGTGAVVLRHVPPHVRRLFELLAWSDPHVEIEER